MCATRFMISVTNKYPSTPRTSKFNIYIFFQNERLSGRLYVLDALMVMENNIEEGLALFVLILH